MSIALDDALISSPDRATPRRTEFSGMTAQSASRNRLSSVFGASSEFPDRMAMNFPGEFCLLAQRTN